jgi:hypothetical protein
VRPKLTVMMNVCAAAEAVNSAVIAAALARAPRKPPAARKIRQVPNNYVADRSAEAQRAQAEGATADPRNREVPNNYVAERRRPGAPRGNSNALRHGMRTARQEQMNAALWAMISAVRDTIAIRKLVAADPSLAAALYPRAKANVELSWQACLRYIALHEQLASRGSQSQRFGSEPLDRSSAPQFAEPQSCSLERPDIDCSVRKSFNRKPSLQLFRWMLRADHSGVGARVCGADYPVTVHAVLGERHYHPFADVKPVEMTKDESCSQEESRFAHHAQMSLAHSIVLMAVENVAHRPAAKALAERPFDDISSESAHEIVERLVVTPHPDQLQLRAQHRRLDVFPSRHRSRTANVEPVFRNDEQVRRADSAREFACVH